MTDKVPATLETIITARIAPIIGEMIPEETLRATVKRTLDQFMLKEFPELVKAELSKISTKILHDELSSLEYQGLWNGQRQQAGPKLQQMIRELVPDIVEAAMAAPMANVVQQLRYQLQQVGRF